MIRTYGALGRPGMFETEDNKYATFLLKDIPHGTTVQITAAAKHPDSQGHSNKGADNAWQQSSLLDTVEKKKENESSDLPPDLLFVTLMEDVGWCAKCGIIPLIALGAASL